MPPERDWATIVGIMHRMHGKFGEVWPCSFRDMQADRQTQTDILITILRTPLGGEVTAITRKPKQSYWPADPRWQQTWPWPLPFDLIVNAPRAPVTDCMFADFHVDSSTDAAITLAILQLLPAWLTGRIIITSPLQSDLGRVRCYPHVGECTLLSHCVC